MTPQSRIKLARRVTLRYLRESSSALPEADRRWVMPNLSAPGSLVLLRGDNDLKDFEEAEEGSIYDVQNADDLAKRDAPGNLDMTDWSNLQPRYMKPVVPDYVRR